jgi:hypothetical protein
MAVFLAIRFSYDKGMKVSPASNIRTLKVNPMIQRSTVFGDLRLAYSDIFL